MPCTYCIDVEGTSLFPQYGVGPHTCFYKIPGLRLVRASHWLQNNGLIIIKRMLFALVVGFGGVLNVEKENLTARQYNLLRLYSWNSLKVGCKILASNRVEAAEEEIIAIVDNYIVTWVNSRANTRPLQMQLFVPPSGMG